MGVPGRIQTVYGNELQREKDLEGSVTVQCVQSAG
jgi:hypothetical protein